MPEEIGPVCEKALGRRAEVLENSR